jgi:hypothetical protein
MDGPLALLEAFVTVRGWDDFRGTESPGTFARFCDNDAVFTPARSDCDLFTDVGASDAFTRFFWLEDVALGALGTRLRAFAVLVMSMYLAVGFFSIKTSLI